MTGCPHSPSWYRSYSSSPTHHQQRVVPVESACRPESSIFKIRLPASLLTRGLLLGKNSRVVLPAYARQRPLAERSFHRFCVTLSMNDAMLFCLGRTQCVCERWFVLVANRSRQVSYSARLSALHHGQGDFPGNSVNFVVEAQNKPRETLRIGVEQS